MACDVPADTIIPDDVISKYHADKVKEGNRLLKKS